MTRSDVAREFGPDAVDELDRILALCAEAADVVARGREAFVAERLLRRAAEAIIMHIGESSSRPRLDAFKARHAFLGDPRGWQIVKDTANFYDHQYADVDAEQTWRILVTDLPALAAFIRAAIDG